MSADSPTATASADPDTLPGGSKTAQPGQGVSLLQDWPLWAAVLALGGIMALLIVRRRA